MTKLDLEDINSASSSIEKLYKLFTEHPRKNGMNYYQHMLRSLKFSLKMGIGSFYLLVHSIFPFIFENNGSKIIISLYQNINNNK
jgi:hypothetical protein